MALPKFSYEATKDILDTSKDFWVTLLNSLLKLYPEHSKEIRTGFDFEDVSKEFLVMLKNVVEMCEGNIAVIREVTIFFYTGDDRNIGQIVPVKLGIPVLIKSLNAGELSENLLKAVTPYVGNSSRVYFQADLNFQDGNVLVLFISKKPDVERSIEFFL